MNTYRKVHLLSFLVLCITPCFAIDMVRIVDSDGKDSNSAKGTVQFLFDGRWGGICFNDFFKEDGGVVCRHLNFPGIREFTFQASSNVQYQHDREISCYGHEENLHNCHHSRIEENDVYGCKESTLYISCYNHSEFSVASSKVRLDGGDGSYGRVKFYQDGWKTICGDESWGELEGGVVCRELGFRGVESVKVTQEPSTEPSSAKFKCDGYEMSLAECQTNIEMESPQSISYLSEAEDTMIPLECFESIEVKCLRSIDFILPHSQRTHEIEVGESFSLKCNATNSTGVRWKHQNWRKESIVGNTTELSLSHISTEDQGSYTCVAKGLRGQVVESDASQTLIISDYGQMLLQTTGEASANETAKIRDYCKELFTNAGFEVFTKEKEDGNFTMQLGKLYKAGINYTTFNKEIDDILDIIRENISTTSNRLPLLKQGLSFCIGEPHETYNAGILHFPSTKINSKSESMELCVKSKTSRAYRECFGDLVSAAEWKDAYLRNCFNTTENPTGDPEELVKAFFKEVEEANVTSENVSVVSRDLADATAIEEVSKKVINDVKTALKKVTNVESASPTVTRNVIETVDNVVNQSSSGDETLNPETSSVILQSFEKQLDTAKQSGSNFTHKRSNIEVKIIQIEDKESPIKFEFFQNETDSETKLNRNDTDIQQEEDLQVAVEIPAIALQDLSENCSIRENSSKSSLPVSFTIFLNGALFNDSTTNKTRNSFIVSTSMLCDVSNLPNGTYISTFFTPTKNDTGEHPWECVFWEPSINGHKNGTGVWSSEGCVECGASRTKIDTCPTSLDTRVSDPVELYKCSWTHLTNFAVLLDVKGDIGSKVLDVITMIGCVVSIIALLITISSHLLMKKLRSSQPKQIIIMLCSSLLGLYLSFVIGIDRTEHPTVCVTFGGLIHFFCLSTVAWMSVEATQLYLLLVKVVNAHVRHFMMKASVIAWGIPFVVVVVCVAVATNAYAHKYCFPAHCSYVFYIGVLGLVALLLIYNMVTYIAIVRSISATRKNISTSQSNRAGMIRRLQNALAILVLLGLSWVFGFLAIGSVRMVFNVLFCLFNSFQGFFIFLLFCLRQDEIREAWRERFGIAICLKTEDDTGTVSEKPSMSTSKHLTRESEVSKPLMKPSEKSEKVELTAFKNIEEATAATAE